MHIVKYLGEFLVHHNGLVMAGCALYVILGSLLLWFMMFKADSWASVTEKENGFWVEKGIISNKLAEHFKRMEQGLAFKVAISISVCLTIWLFFLTLRFEERTHRKVNDAHAAPSRQKWACLPIEQQNVECQDQLGRMNTDMKAVLFKGSIVCCLMGVFFAARFAFEAARIWPTIPHDPSDLFIALSYYWPLPTYTLLAFAPTIFLWNRQADNFPRRLVIIGATELIVFVSFLAMVLTSLFPAS